MNSKLTLSLDSEIIKKAKEYARRNNTSVSKIVEQYFKRIDKPFISQESLEEPETEYELLKSKLSPHIQQIIGIIDETKKIDDDRYNHLMNKYK